ncbi:MAG: methylmalonyl Co-A mutase-associated GTPase MeaB [Acidimicrobiia bacterium]|nr:methylmalonyl Co-A mutase-associated GTPase MeaB [Acidimicrobiia bacterium]
MTQDPTELAERIANGDRRALARGITLVESTRREHRAQAETLVNAVLPLAGRSVRIGLSGPPGVGKSTFTERFGLRVIDEGHRIAVLAVDPSSARSGGSILGDKTRMAELARRPEAFIRPSPGGGELGGVARRTREAMLLCEAFGHDVVMVETIGVGQSEVAVADMVDVFCVLVNPGGGDELQGIKRGIMELADLVVVNKADGDLAPAAQRTAADYRNALHLLRPRWRGWTPETLTCSAVEDTGIAEVWDAVERCSAALQESGELDEHRARQATAWLWKEVTLRVDDELRRHPAVAELLPTLEHAVSNGDLLPPVAAERVLEAWRAVAGDAASSTESTS